MKSVSTTNVLLASLLLLMTVLSLQLIGLLRYHQLLITDLAELRHVRYGMLNANHWVQQISDIVEIKIREIDLEGEKRAAAKAAIENILDTMLTAADQYVREQNATGDWWDRTTGRIKESMRNTLMDIETVKAGIPQYADQILDELEKPETRQEINNFLTEFVSEFAASSFGIVDDTIRDAARERHGCEGSINDCKLLIRDHLASVDARARINALLTLLCAAMMLLLVARSTSAGNKVQWMLLCGAALVLLLCGLLTPMLEVEAQISHLRFMLLGHPVEFFNEVLYFQSKSIFDVVSILMSKREPDMMLVGVLLITFSVIFPMLKLLSSALYVYGTRALRENVLVRFFALKSGKWSMADVMVIAILMTYIGFNGMISSQLDLISRGAVASDMSVLTTNGTALQPGFLMFLAFCVFSLVVSGMLEEQYKQPDASKP
ncbi:MAG TPA: paraquat-inducible protein A [Xanthomonadales bacterium]|nr:paraquat-inducible protein A [Xanthomonadales bacterium]